MAVQEELPRKRVGRAGAGWWMDGSGAWRPPEEWPEDTPPMEGWRRDRNGQWFPPAISSEPDPKAAEAKEAKRQVAAEKKKRLSRQARADRRAMLTVIGALGGAAMLLIVALILITQAGASGTGEVESAEAEVIFEAESDQAVLARRRALAEGAPAIAEELLADLDRRDRSDDETATPVDPGDWVAASADCRDVSEQVLVARSAVPITWADQLECVVDGGLWTDRYLGSNLESIIEVEVEPLVPVENVHLSGGADWTLDTRQAYLADIEHPPTLHIVAAEGGHNPRAQGPDAWRPSNRNTWCAYAVDWVAVKARWELTVTDAEAAALDDMLQTCGEPESAGADPNSMSENSVAPASIAFG